MCSVFKMFRSTNSDSTKELLSSISRGKASNIDVHRDSSSSIGESINDATCDDNDQLQTEELGT